MGDVTVIYHADCPDGYASALVCWKKYGDTAEYVPARYGEEPPDVEGRDVIIVDFSYKRPVTLEMAKKASSIRVLDHHKSAERELEGLDFAVFDMERSGCGIAWDVLHEGKPRPWLIDYVEDRDLWRHALPHSAEVNAFVQTVPMEFARWDEMLGMDVEEAREAGRIAWQTKQAYVRAVRHHAGRVEYDGRAMPVINAPQWGISELLHQLLEDNPGDDVVMGFFRRDDGVFQYSLRSRPGTVDVSEIASRQGGGGHAQAAGFQSADLPEDLLWGGPLP